MIDYYYVQCGEDVYRADTLYDAERKFAYFVQESKNHRMVNYGKAVRLYNSMNPHTDIRFYPGQVSMVLN